jgi:predicted transcriptional regulator
MNLSSNDLEILETMLLNGNSMKATQIAIENNKELTATMTHLTNLIHMGYVNSPQKETYTLTDEGKKPLGIQPITKENAKNILAYTPHDNAFNFHVENNTPHHTHAHSPSHHIHAHSLQDFANKLSKVDKKTIEHHMDKGDFETWFKKIGDKELTKKTAIIRERKITGEQLGILLHNIAEQRCQELMKLTEQTTT